MNNFDLRKYLAEGKLKVSQEKVEEVKNIPDDIEWEFDGVIDQMDAYNATIALTGHSESTGKNYTASAEASRGGSGGDWEWMEEDEVEEVLEEKKGKDHDGDGDIDSDDYLMARDKAIKANLKEWGSSDWHYFLNSMHKDLGNPTDAPSITKVLDVAGDNVDYYWDDWEEYKTDYEGLKMHAAQTYLRTKFPEYFKGMQALFAPMSEESIEESLRAWNVIDIDGNVTHEGLSYEEALAKAKEVEGHKIRPTNMMLGVNEDYNPDQEQLDDEDEVFMPMDDEGRPLGENVDEKYSDFLTALRDSGTVNMFGAAPHLQAEFGLGKREAREILANWMRSFKESLQEALNPEVVKAVNRLIKGLAKKYDYSDRDAVYAIVAALRHEGYSMLTEGYYGSSDIDNIASTLGYDDVDSFFNDNPGAVDAVMEWAETVPDFERMLQDAGMIEEDLDLGHQDDEPGMLKGDLYKIGKYAMELYQMMDDLEDIHGEVDLPHWWQSKITTAKNMISGAKHYLEFELKEPAIDAMVTEDNIEDQAKVYFMQKVKRGEIDKLPEDPKAAFLAQMTKDQIAHDVETLRRERGLEEIGMFHDPVGYEKSKPETPVFTKKYVGKDAYHILKNGKKFMTLFGSEGEANAYLNKRNRELQEEETFYTKSVKDKVVSKLMDQLKK